jgi:hypothetical protein
MSTRRQALQAGVGAAVLGGARALGLVSQGASTFNSAPQHTSGYASAEKAGSPTPMNPLMEHSAAIARTLGDVSLREQVRGKLFEQFQHVSEIDPDLQILKSLSPMVKLTITRQRRVEREMRKIFSFESSSGPQEWSPVRDLVYQHVHRLMWGNP